MTDWISLAPAATSFESPTISKAGLFRIDRPRAVERRSQDLLTDLSAHQSEHTAHYAARRIRRAAG